ncbi:MAG: DUF2066 domain-containing protein [Gammaproteobacteria bacterium]
MRKKLPGYVLPFVCLALLWPGLGTAAEVTGLYEVSVPVTSQSREERQQALQAGLTEILVRVSGRQAVASGMPLPEIEAALTQPSRYAQQFRYRRASVPAATADAEPAGQVLWVKFDQTAVDDLLRRSGLPVWGQTRPAVLVWLAIDDRGQRYLLSNDHDDLPHQLLMTKAERRGIPLILPLMDLTDRAAVRTSDVWGNFEENILKASSRYQPEGILVGQVYQDFNGFWHGRWTLHLDGRRFQWNTQGPVLAEVIDPGIDASADTLGEHFAQYHANDGNKSVVVIEVRDVSSLRDYNRVAAYLQTLANVSGVEPLLVTPAKVLFRLQAQNGRLGIAQSVSLGHVLVAEAQPLATGGSEPGGAATREAPDLVYRLLQ